MMKRFKVLRFSIVLLSVVSIFLAGCQKEENEVFDVNSDVIFLHKIIDNDTVTGVAYYAFANKGISEAAVTLPNEGGTIELEQHPNSSYTFYKQPADEDFVYKESLSNGSYVFNIMSNEGESLEISDLQEMDNLGFAQLDSTGFNEVQKFYYFDWEEVENAQSYVVLLLDAEENIIFTGYSIDNEAPLYYLSTDYDFGVWDSFPQKDESYTLRIQSYIYDSDATNANYAYNIQEISISDFPLVWELD